MAMHTLPKLRPLESPLNYPDCLERITQVAINRANFEIHQNRLFNMVIDGDVLICNPIFPDIESTKDAFKLIRECYGN